VALKRAVLSLEQRKKCRGQRGKEIAKRTRKNKAQKLIWKRKK
jgi:hypothetical protein